MIWGKKKNNMITNLSPATDMEEGITKKLEDMRQSSELRKFMLQIKSEMEEVGIDHVCYRVKTDSSAVRKIRVGKYEDAKEVDDLCGIMIVTDNLDDVYGAVGMIRPMLDNPDEEDLNHKFQAGRGVPPLSYMMKSNMRFNDIDESVPIEVRIHEKKRFLAIQSLYYTLYKNDTIPDSVKWPMDNLMMKVILQQLNIEDDSIDRSIRGNLTDDLEHIIEDNIELLQENQNLVYEAMREFTRVRFEYEYAREIEAASLFDEDILEKINDMLIKIFDEYYVLSYGKGGKRAIFPQGSRFDDVITKMKSLTYSEVIKLIQAEEIKKGKSKEQEL